MLLFCYLKGRIAEPSTMFQVDLLRRKQVNYFYASDQFKGMRQDCTVQHLHNALSASIYEAHARSALEYGDTAEYNQCQAQLLQHYQTGIKGAQEEFAAYRLLHQSVHAGRGNNAGVLFCLQSLTLEVASPVPALLTFAGFTRQDLLFISKS